MGVGAQDVMGRVADSMGDLESVAPDIQPVLDVPHGGVLFALPALLSMGLMKYTEQFFKLPKLADYSVATIAEPTQVVNPVYRDLDGKVRSQVGKLNRMLAKFRHPDLYPKRTSMSVNETL